MIEEKLESLLTDVPESDRLSVFTEAEMSVCSGCLRKNSPTRSNCLYCGGGLEVAAERLGQVRLRHRKLEGWERGWNVVFMPPASGLDDATLSNVADALSFEGDFANRLFRAGVPIPIARVHSEDEANVWIERLKLLGLQSVLVVSDDQLSAETRPRRLRGMKFHEKNLEFIDFNTSESALIDVSDSWLIVAGLIFTEKSETLERRKRGKSQTVEQVDSSSDQPVIDIYAGVDHIGFRILASGFDFSCLADEKSRISNENIGRLLGKILSALPGAEIIENYRDVRLLLPEVWELDRSQEFTGPRRAGLLSAESQKKVTATNLTQFTKFSRLQRLLK